MILFKSFPIGSIFRIPVRVHWSAVLGFVVWITIFYHDCKGIPYARIVFDISLKIALISTVEVAVLIHELAHALAARFMKVTAPVVYLHLFGGVVLFADPKFMNLKPLQEMIVFAAGPVSNLVCFIPAVLTARGGNPSTFTGILRLIAEINLAMGILNMIPVWPLDGGKVLRAFMAMCRLRPGLPELLTLFVSLLLGVPLACLAWKEDAYWIFTILLILLAFAAVLLPTQSHETIQDTSARPETSIRNL